MDNGAGSDNGDGGGGGDAGGDEGDGDGGENTGVGGTVAWTMAPAVITVMVVVVVMVVVMKATEAALTCDRCSTGAYRQFQATVMTHRNAIRTRLVHWTSISTLGTKCPA
jgi:hypothetical protein